MYRPGSRLRISLNAPVTLAFVGVCLAAQLLNVLTGGASNRFVFSVYRSSPGNPLTYVRSFCHVFGHADWSHLMGNMIYILLLGPMLEEKYGAKNLILVIAVTALSTGVFSQLLFPRVMLLGASGVVFALILMSSVTIREDHTIPLTFILVAVFYLGQQAVQGLFTRDSVSQSTHLIGGAVGTAAGFLLSRKK